MRFTHRFFAAIALLAPGGSHALGIGDLHVRSALNQPLQAEVPLVISRENPSDLQVKLASADVFVAAGLERPHFLASLKFTTVRRPDGSHVIEISSRDPIREPFLNFLLEVTWPQGRIVKEFTALLDPPQGTLAPIAPPVLERPSPTGADNPSDSMPPARIPQGNPIGMQETSERTDPVSSRIPDHYGPVQPRDALSMIAHAIGADTGLSTEQVAVGLYRANPDAFFGGNINSLKIGTILTVPSREALAQLNPAEARQEYRRLLHAATLAGRKLPSRESEEQHEGSTNGRQEGANEVKTRVQGPRVELLTPRIRNGQSTAPKTPQAARDEIALEVTESLREENEEIRARLNTLEQQIAALRELLELKDRQIADLQAKVQNPQPLADTQPPANTAAIGTPPETPSLPESRSGNRGPSSGSSDESAAMPVGRQTLSPPAVVPEAERPPGEATNDTWGKAWWLLAGIGSLTGAALLARLASRRQKRLTPSFEGSSSRPTNPSPPGSSVSSPAQPLWTRAATDERAGVSAPGETTADGSSLGIERGSGTIDVLAEVETLLRQGKLDEVKQLLLTADDQAKTNDGLVKLLEMYSAQGNQDVFNALLEKLKDWKKTQPERWGNLARMNLKLRVKSALAADDPHTVATATTASEFVPSLTSMEETPATAPETVAKEEESTSESIAPLEFDLSGLDLKTPPASTPETEIQRPVEPRIVHDAPMPREEIVVDAEANLEDLLAELTAGESKRTNHGGKIAFDDSRTDRIEVTSIDPTLGRERTTDPYSEITDHDPLETKLDLGKVYADMGDTEEARELLQEVLERGDDRQRAEARSLLQRLERGPSGSEQSS